MSNITATNTEPFYEKTSYTKSTETIKDIYVITLSSTEQKILKAGDCIENKLITYPGYPNIRLMIQYEETPKQT